MILPKVKDIVVILSNELFLDAVLAKLILQLLLKMLTRQFLISILFYQDRLLQIIHHLQDQNQLLLLIHLQTLQVTLYYLTPTQLQIPHLMLPIFLHHLLDQYQSSLHTLCLLVNH